MMNYNKLWKLLIDKNMLKKDLREKAGLSTNVIAKMGKGGDVSTQVLRKICEVLDCQIEDIVELDPRKDWHALGQYEEGGYAYADTEHKRKAIEKAMEHSRLTTELSASNGQPAYKITDEDLLKRLYGLD